MFDIYSLEMYDPCPILNRVNRVDKLPELYEPVLVETQEQSFAAWVEDEIILRLPIVAMHGPGECAPGKCSDKASKTELPELTLARKNPFDVLTKLKSRQSAAPAKYTRWEINKGEKACPLYSSPTSGRASRFITMKQFPLPLAGIAGKQ